MSDASDDADGAFRVGRSQHAKRKRTQFCGRHGGLPLAAAKLFVLFPLRIGVALASRAIEMPSFSFEYEF